MLVLPYEWLQMARRHRGILAGGALRDLVTGRLPPKDVDIFVPGLLEGDGQEAYMDGFYVNNIDHNGTRYQIIKHRFGEGDDFLCQFDLGLCKVSFDPMAGWTFTEDFVHDIANRQITVLNTHHFNHEKHLASVVARYPDYTVVPYEGDILDF